MAWLMAPQRERRGRAAGLEGQQEGRVSVAGEQSPGRALEEPVDPGMEALNSVLNPGATGARPSLPALIVRNRANQRQ